LNQDFMATLQKRIAEWTSIGKDVAQIIALMGVGLWTLFVYLRTESPSTAGQMDTTASFASSPLDDGGCELRFNFAVQNNAEPALGSSGSESEVGVSTKSRPGQTHREY
jgi:hypothetical protein